MIVKLLPFADQAKNVALGPVSLINKATNRPLLCLADVNISVKITPTDTQKCSVDKAHLSAS